MATSQGVVLVGCGNHARDFYLPLLSELNAPLVLVVDIASREAAVRAEIAQHHLDPVPEVFLVDDRHRDAEDLPDAVSVPLTARLRELGVDQAIVSTEPKAHKSYAKYFLRTEIDVMVDKPLTAPLNASVDPAQARKVYADYEELLKLSEQHPAVRFTLHCQRRYDPAFRYIKILLDMAVQECQVPVTHIDVHHGNGHWNMPPEFESREDHPHKYGYGKLLHSGYHYVDLFAWFCQSNEWLDDRTPDHVRLVQQTQQPDDLLFQLGQAGYAKFFGEDTFGDFFAAHPESGFKDYGETESCSVIHLMRDGHVVTSGTIRLVDTTVSRRAWAGTPANVNIGNGRIRHSQLSVSVGPLLTVQLHSYESYERRFRKEVGVDDPAEPGNWDHEDVYVFRNHDLIGDKSKPLGGPAFERLRGRELADQLHYPGGQDDDRCTLERGQRQMLEEFLHGEPPATSLQRYSHTCRLLSLLLQASAEERQGNPPLVEGDY
ncbi:MAG: Gfo/Idh/MocA family oxidoreductase [Acidimicrobiales bacterium]